MLNGFQPYIGPRPFERDDADKGLFFGRDSEANDLLSRAIAHPAVLFYSHSGAGKTSLINAKLIPMLEKKGFEILRAARVRGLRPQNIKREEIQNIYVFNALRSWDDNKTDPKLLIKTSLTDFLKRRERSISKDGDKSPCIAIFDQFEELFTFYQERWKDRQDFFEQVSEALEKDRLMRVVFAMREDYIAELDPYLSLLPEKLRTRYRLERLREQEALSAATGPLEESEYSFADGVADQLVNNLLMVPVETPSGLARAKGAFVEPVQLQVVCQSLWENCQSSWQDLKPSEPKIITREHLETFGDVDVALSTFYENAIRKVVQSTGINEGKLRKWFEETLITPAGTRGAVFRGQEETGGIPTTVVDELVNHHLITGEIRGGSKWLELTHDRLIEPIQSSNERWRLRHSEGEKLRKLLEAKASQWMRSGRNNADLLDEGELLEARRWLDSPTAADLGYSNVLFALVQASRAAIDEVVSEREQALAAEQQRRAEAERERAEEKQRRIEEQAKATRYLRWLVAALAAMFLCSTGMGLFAKHQQTQAFTNEQKAEKNEKEAIEAREVANNQRKQSDEHAAQLQVANEKLIEATKEAERERQSAIKERQNAVAQAAEASRAKRQMQIALAQVKNEKTKIEKQNDDLYLLTYAQQLRSSEIEALLYQSKGRNEDALAIYKNLIDAYANMKFIHSQRRVLTEMAAIYHAQGNLEGEKKTRDKLESLVIPISEALLKVIQQNGVESAISQYHDLRRNHADKYYFDENELNDLGYTLLRGSKVKEAIQVFKLNCEEYPQGYNTYDSLGEAYMKDGNRELAILNYEKSLKLNPQNTNAVEKLKKIRAMK